MTEGADESFLLRLRATAKSVEDLLSRLLDGRPLAGEIFRPERLLAAMRHGVLNGGKRLRPFLLCESAALFEGDAEAALRVAAALECIHCYSLIHDDLPAMDDDDLRRGQPTVHKRFDEATAILAGDALLALAFAIIADEATQLEPQRRIALVAGLARASGPGGMAGGQALDLDAEKRGNSDPLGEADVIRLQAMKTGALIRFAAEAGAIVGGADASGRERLAEFGAAVGLAFQLADDLLDLTQSAERLGKASGKDAARGKATLPALNGVDWTRRQLDGLVAEACDLLQPWGSRADTLRAAARFVATRES